MEQIRNENIKNKPSRTECLESHEDYRITYHPAENAKETLIVTFAGQPGALGEAGFGTGFCIKNGYDSIYVGQRFETHFQGLSLENFERIVKPYTDGRRVICYGSSLGAYAALYYGGSIDAEILAAAPMLPSWPSLKNPAYGDFELMHLHMSEVPKSKNIPTVIFDPLIRNDCKFIDETVRVAYPDAHYVELPYAGHTLLLTMDAAGILTQSICAFFETGVLPEIMLPTEGSAIYHVNYAKSLLSKGQVHEAIKHARRSFDIEISAGNVSTLIRGLYNAGEINALIHLIDHELSEKERIRFVDRVKSLTPMVDKARSTMKS